MDSVKAVKSSKEQPVTVEDVNRLLDLGRLLLTVLTTEEKEALQKYLSDTSTSGRLGNAGDS